ncbi:hypothetical protein [Planctomycetes bacterium Pan216]|uniref:hypothetical protein n=1 Tax=Kolteria novifilia TaxID=2527975 RepID=UPI00119FD4AD
MEFAEGVPLDFSEEPQSPAGPLCRVISLREYATRRYIAERGSFPGHLCFMLNESRRTIDADHHEYARHVQEDIFSLPDHLDGITFIDEDFLPPQMEAQFIGDRETIAFLKAQRHAYEGARNVILAVVTGEPFAEPTKGGAA